MINEEEKLKKYIKENNIDAEHLRFDKTLHTVQDTLNVTGFELKYITKSMIFKDAAGRTIIGMVPAEFRVSSEKLGKMLNVPSPEIVGPEEAHQRTGYPVGGMPRFGYEAILIIDPRVLKNEYIYTGGGSEYSLVKISIKELLRITKPIVGNRIRGNKSN